MPDNLPLTADDLKRVRLLAQAGVTEATIARACLMSPATFRRRKATMPELVSALEEGRDTAHIGVASALYNRAAAGDVRAIIWWEQTRMGITPKLVVKTADQDTDPFAELTPEQKLDRLQGLVVAHINGGEVRRLA
jgi:uncharacterized protein (DUF2384 family)